MPENARRELSNFSIPFGKVDNEVTWEGLRQLYRLWTHLQNWRLKDPQNLQTGSLLVPVKRETEPRPQEIEKWKYRMAPSIITRSEAELFGLSNPRFAIRAELPGDWGIVNLRRLKVFADRCTGKNWLPLKSVSKRIQDAGDECILYFKEHPDRTLEMSLRSQKICIADCVLTIPPEARRSYHLVLHDFSTAYGECVPLVGTPFVNHLELQGGGMCAQAACFMAAALMNRHTTIGPDHPQGTMHGIAEITALADPDYGRRSTTDGGEARPMLRLQGLALGHFERYFSQIGLFAPMQTVNVERRFSEDEQRFGMYHRALRGYLRSGMPVILSTSIDRQPWRADGNRDLLENRLAEKAWPDHAVVAVGCGIKGTPSERNVLIHDPASLPYIEADVAEVFASARREIALSSPEAVESVMESIQRFLRLPPKGIRRGEKFCAVAPGRVRMTLEGVERYPTCVQLGLFDIAYLTQKLNPWKGDSPRSLRDEWIHFLYRNERYAENDADLGEFQLIQLGSLRCHRDIPEDVRQSILDGFELGRLRTALKNGWLPTDDRWVWIQRRRHQKYHHIYIWDAELDFKVFVDCNAVTRNAYDDDAYWDAILHVKSFPLLGLILWNGPYSRWEFRNQEADHTID